MSKRPRLLSCWEEEGNLQACLATNIKFNEFERFCDALTIGGDPTKALPPPRKSYSAFEYALSTKGRARFVEECIKWGCNPCNINRKVNASALHFAIKSEDPLIVETLLQHPCIDVNRQYKGQTALNILIDIDIEKNDAESDDDILICIEQLLVYGASPNIPNKNGLLPIKQALDNNKVKLIKLLLKNSELEIDSTIRTLLNQNYPKLDIPMNPLGSPQSPMKLLNIWESYLTNEADILGMLKIYLLQSTQIDTVEERRSLNTNYIIWSIQLNYSCVFNALQQFEFDVNSKVLETALIFRNSYALKHLILYDELSVDTVSETLIRVLWVHKVNKSDVPLCCDKVKENYRNEEGFTFLSVVDLFSCENIIRKLLERGEYIGARNPKNRIDPYRIGTRNLTCRIDPDRINRLEPGVYALRKVSAELLEQHLNTCITTNSVDPRAVEFEILIDYQNLIPPKARKTNLLANAMSAESLYKSRSFAACHCRRLETTSNLPQIVQIAPTYEHSRLNIPATPEFDSRRTQLKRREYLKSAASHSTIMIKESLSEKLREEIDSITFFAGSPKYRHLITHPVIRSFIYLKWHCISKMFYLNVGCYVAFWLSMLIYAFLLFVGNDDIATVCARFAFRILAWSFTILLTLRELFHVKNKHRLLVGLKVYLRSILNITECCLIVCAFGFLVSSNASLAVIVILLMSWELGVLLATIPILNISTLMLMWKTVFTTFLKCFLTFLAFLVNFSVAFLILSLNNGSANTDNERNIDDLPKNVTLSISQLNRNTSSNNADSPPSQMEFEFNKFPNIWAAVLKTIVMLTGEFDASSLQLHDWFTSTIFLLFLVLVTIVLSNLLYGLAVSDTQSIQVEAELSGLLNRVCLLKRYVKVIESIERSFLQGFLKYLAHFDNNEDYHNCRGIAIRLNQANKVRFLTRDNRAENQCNCDESYRRIFDHFATGWWTLFLRKLRKLYKSHQQNSSDIQFYSMYLDTDTIKLALKVIQRKKVIEIENKRSQESKIWRTNFEYNIEEKLASIQNEQKSYVEQHKERFCGIEEKLNSVEENLSNMKESIHKILSLCQAAMPGSTIQTDL